ncbi:MAG: DUF3073 domain-containing protein [Frankiaceae bacterium]|nr:DUF3073 domain-containing protein [Frankiaceae bacterium]
MGRGRAKAKQTKVARDLKYNSGGTDLERLKAELAGRAPAAPAAKPAEDDEFADPYASDEDDEDEDDLAAK